MTKMLSVFLLLFVCFSQSFGQGPKAAASDDAEVLKQLERDWSNAQKTGDADKLGQILADDWVGLGFDGVTSTKQKALSDVKSGANKLESFEMAPMDVKIIGTVAIVQGSDTEKSSLKGKDTSGKWVWMDVFVKRAGKWQAVRSQSAMVR
jgi:hypothetical protein